MPASKIPRGFASDIDFAAVCLPIPISKAAYPTGVIVVAPHVHAYHMVMECRPALKCAVAVQPAACYLPWRARHFETQRIGGSRVAGDAAIGQQSLPT